MDTIKITYPIFSTHRFITTCNLPEEFDDFDCDELADFTYFIIDKCLEPDPAHGLNNAFEVGYAKIEIINKEK